MVKVDNSCFATPSSYEKLNWKRLFIYLCCIPCLRNYLHIVFFSTLLSLLNNTNKLFLKGRNETCSKFPIIYAYKPRVSVWPTNIPSPWIPYSSLRCCIYNNSGYHIAWVGGVGKPTTADRGHLRPNIAPPCLRVMCKRQQFTACIAWSIAQTNMPCSTEPNTKTPDFT